MSATDRGRTDSDSETVRAEGIIEGDKMDKGKETIGKKTAHMLGYHAILTVQIRLTEY